MNFDYDKLKTLIRKYALEWSGGLLMGLSIMFGGIGGIAVIVMTIAGVIDVEESGGILPYILKLLAIIIGSVLAFILGLYLFKKSKVEVKPKAKKNKYGDFSLIKGVKEESDSVTLAKGYIRNLSEFGFKRGPFDFNLAVFVTDYLTKHGFTMDYAEIGFMGDCVSAVPYCKKYTSADAFIESAVFDFEKKSGEAAADKRGSFVGLFYEYIRMEFNKEGERLFIDTKNDLYVRMELKKNGGAVDTVKNLLNLLNITSDIKAEEAAPLKQENDETDIKIRGILTEKQTVIDITEINLAEKNLQENLTSVQFGKTSVIFDSGIKASKEQDAVKFYRYVAAANKTTVTEDAKGHLALFKYEKLVPVSELDSFTPDYYSADTKWERWVYKSKNSYSGYGNNELTEILLNRNPEFKNLAFSKDRLEKVLAKAADEQKVRISNEERIKAEALKRDEEYKKKQEEQKRRSRTDYQNYRDYANYKVPKPEKGPFAKVEKFRYRLHSDLALGFDRNILFPLGPHFETEYDGRIWDSVYIGFDLRQGKPYAEVSEGYGGWAPRSYQREISFEEFKSHALKHAPQYAKITADNWQEYFKEKIEKLNSLKPEIHPVKVTGAEVYSVTDEMRENFSYAFILLKQTYGASVVYFRKCGNEFRAFTAQTRGNDASIPNFIGSLKEEYITKIMEGSVSIGKADAFDRVLTEEEANYLLYRVYRKRESDGKPWHSVMGGDFVAGALYFKDTYVEAEKTEKFVELEISISAIAKNGATIAREV